MNLRSLAIDTDAFLALRTLGLLDPIVIGFAQHARLVVTGWVASHELSTVAADVERLSEAGALHVEQLVRGSPAVARYREFKARIARREKDMKRVDLGEAEAVAWALDVEPRPVFVSCDAGARAFAERNGVAATDVLGIGVAAVRLGVVPQQLLAERLASWNSPDQFTCKPTGYTTFEEAFAKRWSEEATLLDP